MLPNTHCPGGQGGVATLWAEWLDPYALKADEEGNERIVCTLFNIPGRPLCVINCYLSSGNSNQALVTFHSDIDMLHELVTKYSQSHEVIIAGDLNEDHYHRNSSKEKQLKNLIGSQKISDIGSHDTSPTYINPNLGHESRIDHILVKPHKDSPQLWGPASIPDINPATNSSKHLPLSTVTHCSTPQFKKKPKAKLTYARRFDWEKADPDC